MTLQSDVTWGLQSSESLTGAEASTSKMAHSHSGQVGSSPCQPLHRVESLHKMAVDYPEQAIQETKMQVAVTLCLPSEVTYHHLAISSGHPRQPLIPCGAIWEVSTAVSTPRVVRTIKPNSPCET